MSYFRDKRMTTNDYNKAVENFADPIYRYAVSMMRNKMLAEDIVQETFAKVWVKHEQIQPDKIKSYLFTTAYHCALDSLKKEQKLSSLDGTDIANQDENPHHFDLQAQLNEALDKLPSIQKSVILLRDYEGYSYGEIAGITALNESQVKVYIFRARQTLKNYIRKIELIA